MYLSAVRVGGDTPRHRTSDLRHVEMLLGRRYVEASTPCDCKQELSPRTNGSERGATRWTMKDSSNIVTALKVRFTHNAINRITRQFHRPGPWPSSSCPTELEPVSVPARSVDADWPTWRQVNLFPGARACAVAPVNRY